ncbi:hypothetical protein SAMN05421543_11457 [Alicyclobacillus macrosporangiidus]|uniref:Uncharacterized protein n=1 Tax=Alicyclobacillus macrosporangiidus TaxID=392015 RepID=A0A1I7K8T2_9BACL|nr:hypothetical protein SAMN05421543_11457 [Alicyclobacillus macrosporangiidus]
MPRLRGTAGRGSLLGSKQNVFSRLILLSHAYLGDSRMK